MAKKQTVVEEETTRIGPDEYGRYYYKDKQGRPAYNLKSPLKDEEGNYVEITRAEWDALTVVPPYEPTEEELHREELKRQVSSLKAELAKTDYVVIKIAESDDTDEIAALRTEYASVIAHRKEVRSQINDLLEELGE